MENTNNETLNIVNDVVKQVNETIKPELNKKNEEYLQKFIGDDHEEAYQEYINDYVTDDLTPYNGDISKNVDELIERALKLAGSMNVKRDVDSVREVNKLRGKE